MSKNMLISLMSVVRMWSFTQVPLDNTMCQCVGIWLNIQSELSHQLDSNCTS